MEEEAVDFSGVDVLMSLRVVCGRCGELLYSVSGVEMVGNPESFCVPDVVFGSKLNGVCPGCGRRFSHDDVKNMQVRITGKRADAAFYAKGGRKKGKRIWFDELARDHPENALIEPTWPWHPGSKKGAKP
jgi:hypothetical protein